ncbi:tetratricopeptide repeat protein, partial [Streptomyces sp. NPDC002454]
EALLTELTAWCGLGGFGAWLLHGPGGQGKTRLAHHLAGRLAAEGWTALWPRARATADALHGVRHAARPLLVVLDYAEVRTDQLAALVEAAAEHPGTSPLKLLLLARTDGDWWREAAGADRVAEDHLATARVHRLAPLEDDPDRRPDHYREVVRALTAALPLVDGMTDPVTTLPAPSRCLGQDAYANALTLHMTALADLLDTARPGPEGDAAPGGADAVEDRLLGHERRYWRQNAAARGLTPALSATTLESALAAAHLSGAGDREAADRLWSRLPALADQPRDRRDRVTAWLAALYPTTSGPGAPPWGSLQPDRLAERHAGHVLTADPALADHLLDGADDAQATQLLTVYSRAAAHPGLPRLDGHLTDLCVRHHRTRAAQIVATATRSNHPAPLVAALGALGEDPALPLDELAALSRRLPPSSQRLAVTAARLARTVCARQRALAEQDPDAHLPDLARALNNLAIRLGEVGRREEALTAIEEAAHHYRALAERDPDSYLRHRATALNNLGTRLGKVGRRKEAVPVIRESIDIRRALAERDPDSYLSDLSASLNNLSVELGELGRREEALGPVQEAVDIRRALAERDPGTYLPDLAVSLNNLSVELSALGRRGEALAAVREATDIRRTLAEANPDAHLADLAKSLSNLSVDLGRVGRPREALPHVEEATTHYRALAGGSPEAHLPDLAMALNNLSVCLGELGRQEEALARIEEATTHYRTLAEADPGSYLPNLAMALNNLSVDMRRAGRRDEALTHSESATDHYRALVEANPDAHLPGLAMSLLNLSAGLGAVKRHGEALAASEEATGHYRALAETSPGAHLPNLAQSLLNFSTDLAVVGRRAEALAVIEEANERHRALAEAEPTLFGPRLQHSLEVTALLEGLDAPGGG